MPTDQRLIEDYIPIEAISAEARREKSIRKGHISTLHLWWARRPLVAARAAVYGALVPATVGKQKDKDTTSSFVADLCKYPGAPDVIAEARGHILEAHAERLTAETGHVVTAGDIEAGRAPRPRVLDMFAGGGAIPLEALRLGCEAYALDLNPVAHLIELCTLVYPQQYGKPDPAARGSAKDGTWAGLAAEVEHWGKWVLAEVKKEISDLYPPIPDPDAAAKGPEPGQYGMDWAQVAGEHDKGMLTPVAYLWTRTVRCKNPACGGVVPLARQTWLVQKESRHVALRPDVEARQDKTGDEKRVQYRVVEAVTEGELGFDPAVGSRGGNVACPFCGTVVDSTYVKGEGRTGRIGAQPMAVVCTREGKPGKTYLSADQAPHSFWPDEAIIRERLRSLEARTADDLEGPLTVPEEPLPLVDARGAFFVKLYGLERWGDLFTPRQMLAAMTFANHTRAASRAILRNGYSPSHAVAVTTYLGLLTSRSSDWNSSLTHWTPQGEKLGPTFTRMALAMVWDFVEITPFAKVSGNATEALERIGEAIRSCSATNTQPGRVTRGSATQLPYDSTSFDAIITDPPYYDNVPYADLSDFFYVWLKRAIGFIHKEHLSSVITPKKREAIMDAGRHGGDKRSAQRFYEQMMAEAFAEAGRVLKPRAPLIIVYAHKTTLGWSTLVEALRTAEFTISEAWPLDTERPGRPRANDSAALASSVFLVARRREGDEIGSYEREVQPELQRIVRERVERLWAQGVTGADLVIACVGAGLRAFTRYARVEYANGEPVPADGFLAEVEGAVLEALLEKIFGVSQAGVASVDAVTRFYVLWRYAYRQAAIDAGEAIIFAYPQHVELDGPRSLSYGGNPLVEKSGSKYRLRDFTERASDEKLGLPHNGVAAPLVDVLHRVLWLVENRPRDIAAYLDEAQPDLERLRVVAQTLAGQTLAGNGTGGGRSLVAARGAEAAALRKLTTNWRSLVETSSRRGLI